MATGTNGIATRGDLNGLLPQSTYKFWTTDLTKCPTKLDIMTAYYTDSSYYYRINVSNTYQDNQLVKYSDCSLQRQDQVYEIQINLPNCVNGNSFNLNSDWHQSNGNYTASYNIYIDLYSGTDVVNTVSIPVQFKATSVSNGVINTVSGQSVAAASISISKQIIVNKLQIRNATTSNDWYHGITNGSQYIITSPGNTNRTINWHQITIEFI